MKKTNVVFYVIPIPPASVSKLILLLSLLYQRHPWGCCSFRRFPGNCSCCRDSASSTEPGLPSLEHTGHTGGHGAHLPETHHGQFIHHTGGFLISWELVSFSKLCCACIGGAVRRRNGFRSDRRVGGAAGQLLPMPLERWRQARATCTHPVVQSERRERPALRLQAHFWSRRSAEGGVRGGEVDYKEREVVHPDVCQRAGLCTQGEGALSHIQSIQRRRRSERSPVSHSEPGAASPHQRPGTISLCLSLLYVLWEYLHYINPCLNIHISF